MELYILFGLPGAGKTFVGKIFSEHFGFYFYEGDDDLTQEMKDAIVTKTPFTDAMRDVFFEKLIKNIKELHQKHKKIVVAQTFIKEKYRNLLLDAIPDAKFIFVQAEDTIRESRLLKRTEYPLDLEYSRNMKRMFELPEISHLQILNNANGVEKLTEEIGLLLGH